MPTVMRRIWDSSSSVAERHGRPRRSMRNDPGAPVSRFNGEQIDDYLDPSIRPSTVLMNPPFSASPDMFTTGRTAIDFSATAAGGPGAASCCPGDAAAGAGADPAR
jgi:hypothetical protein